MKPTPFHYFAPDTVEEAVGLLKTYAEDAKVLAGGQSLIPMMNLRLAQPRVLVNVCNIPALDHIDRNDACLRIGATATQSTVLDSAEVRVAAPVICDALHAVGHEAIRNRGTFGGSAAHADPAAEIPALLLALDAELISVGPDGARTIAASDFFQDVMTTALAPDEVLTGIDIPIPDVAWQAGFAEVTRRHGDFALAGVVIALTLDDEDRVAAARIALMGGVAATPVRAHDAEAELLGNPLDQHCIATAAWAARWGLSPVSDMHASADYRCHAVEVLTRRVLTDLRDGQQ